MKPCSRSENYELFCKLAKKHGVCDVMSGNDNHKRVRLGKEGKFRARFEVHSRKEYMLVYYDETDKLNASDLKNSQINIREEKKAYYYYGEIYPDDYEAFLIFVASKLGRKTNIESKDINVPKRPKRIIRENGNPIEYQCPSCDFQFKKSSRCPECGQLVKE